VVITACERSNPRAEYSSPGSYTPPGINTDNLFVAGVGMTAFGLYPQRSVKQMLAALSRWLVDSIFNSDPNYHP
jgi:hypothetical protein